MAVTGTTGHYVTNPVLPDTYKVSFRDPANRYVAQYYDNQPTWATANPVTVVAGADTPGINAAADPVAPPAPVLTGISVAPSESSLLSRGSQQFTAVGNYVSIPEFPYTQSGVFVHAPAHWCRRPHGGRRVEPYSPPSLIGRSAAQCGRPRW